MYTIKEASARTGVGAPLIRAWERRYGVIAPTRTPGGYRLYDDTSIRTLLTMRALVDGGWTASEAARAIRAGEVELVGAGDGPAPVARTGPPGTANRARLIERFVASATSASPVETEAVLDEILASGSFEAVVDDLLLPATAALGDAWASGRISVAAEHAASAAVGRRLAAIFQAGGTPGRVAVVVGPAARRPSRARGARVRRGPAAPGRGRALPRPRRHGRRLAGRGRANPCPCRRHRRRDRRTTAPRRARSPRRSSGSTCRSSRSAGREPRPDLVPGGRAVVLPARVVDAAEVIAGSVGRRR